MLRILPTHNSSAFYCIRNALRRPFLTPAGHVGGGGGRRHISCTRPTKASAPSAEGLDILYFRCGEPVNDRYTVLRFIGGGPFSLTYLVHDASCGRFAVLKLAAPSWLQQKDKFENEAAMLRHVHGARPEHPGHAYVASTLLDTFDLESPECLRTCWITPVYGPSYKTALKSRLPLEFIKSSTRKILLALSYLHDVCHVVHGVVDETNIVLDIANNVYMSQRSPEYYAPPAQRGLPLSPMPWEWPYEADMPIRLLDFTCARHLSHHYADDLQTWPMYRAPEIYLRSGWSTSSDIWSLGVSLFGCITGEGLINPRNVPPHISRDFDVVLQMYQLLGTFPQKMLQEGARSTEWFWPDGTPKTPRIPPRWSLAQRLRDARSPMKPAMSAVEHLLTADFLGRMVRLDPAERATASQLLLHPWFDSSPRG